jgi:membrane-associated PAP2 superfamily phosphatase
VPRDEDGAVLPVRARVDAAKRVSRLLPQRRRPGFLVEQSALLAAAAALLLAVFSGSDLDPALTRVFFDAERGTFPATNDWWLKTLLHDDSLVR